MPITLSNINGTGNFTLVNNTNTGNIALSNLESVIPTTTTSTTTTTTTVGSTSINVWVWGDSSTGTFTSSLALGLSSSGYTYSITASRLSTTYNGNEITGSNPPDVLIMWTNGGDYGGSTLSGNIRKYLNNGGGFVTYVFMPSIKPVGWDVTLTPVQSGTQGYGVLGTGSLVSSSVILQGVDLSLNNVGSRTYFYETLNTPFTQSGATITATWPSINQPLLVEKVSGSNDARLAYINIYPPGYVNNATGSRLLVTRAALWAAKKI